MLSKLFVWFLFTKCIYAQLNGQFWWLNKEVSEINGKAIPPPEYEDLTEFDTDETRILFNEDVHTMRRKIINNPKNAKQIKMRPSSTHPKINRMVNRQDLIIFGNYELEDNNKFVWPSDDGRNQNKFNHIASTQRFDSNDQTTEKKSTAITMQDEFGIKFPEKDTFFVPEPKRTVSTTVMNTQTAVPTYESTPEGIKNIDVVFFDSKIDNKKQTKNICTYIKKQECLKNNGFIYTVEFGKSLKVGPKDPTLVCCILPSPIKKNSENVNEGIVVFRNKISSHQRSKRSNGELKQRNILLKRRQPQEHKTISVPTEIMTAEDEDPYWNIKNSFNPTKRPIKVTDYDYKDDHVHEFTDELPRPGLIGIYSDKRKPTSWSVTKRPQPYDEDADYGDVDDPGTSFGYGSVDPRQGNMNTKKGRKPIKLHTDENKYNPEGQIIIFQSNPNFEVLQGFKLLNLVRNKNKMLSKKTNEKDNERNDSEDQESVIEAVTNFKTDFKQERFGNCGNPATKSKQKDVQIGETEEGSHPWLVVVTPATDQNDILCYGTLIHPRAALTAGDCVSEIPSDGIVVLAGLWKLNEKTTGKKRTPQIHLHPKFKPGDIANNLAILSWSHPFRLCDEIQTACLAEPREGKNCMIYGWGGFDQALRLRSRWQRTRMHECSANKANLPKNAFCGTVQSRGTVSGVGGPLLCNVDGHDAVVGVAVYRDTDVVFLPAKEWAMQANEFLNED